MSYTVVNEELRIQSCSIEDLSQEDKDRYVEQFKGDKIETLTLFYDPVTDIVVLNRDHKDFDIFEIAAETFMSVDRKTRAAIIKKTESIMIETIELLNQIAWHREQLQKDKKAFEVRKVLGSQVIEPYLQNLDMLRALRRIDKCHNDDGFFDDYNPFVYGYIQGIRAERARRKKVSL